MAVPETMGPPWRSDMNIEGLVLDETVRHLAEYCHIRNMEPMARHILKTSQTPILVEMRKWMRREALRQFHQANREQPIMTKQLSDEPYAKGSNFRRSATIHPYFALQMTHRDKTTWNDPDYIGYVKREDPKLFPKRDHI